MGFELRIRITLRCPKHPRYDPVRGEGAIKGGCERCTEILAAYRRVLEAGKQIPGVKVTEGRAAGGG